MKERIFRAKITFLLTYLFIACSPESTFIEHISLNDEKITLDNYIIEKIRTTNQPFDWNKENSETLFKAISLSDNTLVIGYKGGIETRNTILNSIYERENNNSGVLGNPEQILVHKDDELKYFSVKITRLQTLEEIRQLEEVDFVEVNEYPIDLIPLKSYNKNSAASDKNIKRSQISPLDPNLLNPDYPTQVSNYDNTLGIVVKRHNIDKVYLNHQIFGENIGIAVLDNGIVPWAHDLFINTGYGIKNVVGFYHPLWFVKGIRPDGIEPQPYDVFGISEALEPQWLHGSGMVQSAMVISPNANITCARVSTAIVILFADQIHGITKGIKAMSKDPSVKITSMSLGTFFYIHRIVRAIDNYHSTGKIMLCAAGTSFEEVKDILGVIFPAYRPNTISVTGIKNRLDTNGDFIEGETAHTGKQNDFCVERSAASSEATARMAGMFALVWSANPDLTREEIINIMIESSYFYKLNGHKDPKFGWGTVDVLEAVEKALEKN